MKKNIKIIGVAGLKSRRIRQKGMTMIEVVVAMLIIGLGLAMSISMIQTSNRFGDSAEYSHIALEQAQAIIDKIRANRVAARTYIFDGGASATSTDDAMYNSVSNLANYESGISGLTNSCSPDIDAADCGVAGQTARNDMTDWSQNIRALLPGGRGLIFANGTSFEVVILWRNNPETESNLNANAQGIRMSFTL